MIQQFYCKISARVKWKHICIKTCTQMFRATSFIIAKKWKPSECPSSADLHKHTVQYPHQGSLAVERDHVLILQHGWTVKRDAQGHDSAWSVRKRWLCRDQVEERLPGTRGEEEMGSDCYEVWSFWGDENALALESSDSHATLWMCWKPLVCTLLNGEFYGVWNSAMKRKMKGKSWVRTLLYR